jgi:malonyl-CoA decarboxylase
MISLSLTDIGEQWEGLLLESESERIRDLLSISNQNVLKTVKDLIQTHGWIQNEEVCEAMKGPLLRLCGRYLYIEKRRGFALNPVGMFKRS